MTVLWDGSALLVATPASSPTSRNLQATGTVRLGIGPTRDAVSSPCGWIMMYLKELRLITAERAQQLGLPAEVPVFVSPFVQEARWCERCRGSYRPLVYQAGYVIRAHHYHADAGGIYFTRLPAGSYWDDRLAGGWYAVVEPRGARSGGRAEAVYVAAILAYDLYDQERVSAGLVVRVGAAGALAPLHDSPRRQGVVCRFRMSAQGEILLSPLPEPT